MSGSYSWINCRDNMWGFVKGISIHTAIGHALLFIHFTQWSDTVVETLHGAFGRANLTMSTCACIIPQHENCLNIPTTQSLIKSLKSRQVWDICPVLTPKICLENLSFQNKHCDYVCPKMWVFMYRGNNHSFTAFFNIIQISV